MFKNRFLKRLILSYANIKRVLSENVLEIFPFLFKS